MYSAKINGEPTTFGTSGMLYRSNKVMYDRLTETLWNQLRGEPMVGELVGSGIKLEYFPVALTTLGRVASRASRYQGAVARDGLLLDTEL